MGRRSSKKWRKQKTKGRETKGKKQEKDKVKKKDKKKKQKGDKEGVRKSRKMTSRSRTSWFSDLIDKYFFENDYEKRKMIEFANKKSKFHCTGCLQMKDPKKSRGSLCKECILKDDHIEMNGGGLCLPCVAPIVSGIGSALGIGAAGVGAAKIAKSYSSSSSGKYRKGKVKRKEKFEIINKNKKKKEKYSISQNNLEVIITDGKKKTKKRFKTLKKANQYFEKNLRKSKACKTKRLIN